MMARVRDLDHAIDIFEGELARRGRKPATRQKYREVLYPLAEFLTSRGVYQPWEVTADHCREYLNRWVNASASTMALSVSCLTQFFVFLYDEEIITENPMTRIRRPRRPPAEELDVTTVSTADVHRLLDAAREWDEILCMALLVYLGPRRTAAAGARRSDVDLERGTIRFKEKGGKVITKPVPHELAAIITAADEAGIWRAAPDAYLIPNRGPIRSGKRSAKVIYSIVKRLGERAGVEVHPHALRAAFAVSYLDRFDGDTYGLQKLMGHTRPETTQVYLRRHDDFKAMEKVRDLSWGAGARVSTTQEADGAGTPSRPGSEFPSSRGVPPTGFEPVKRTDPVPEVLRSKLAALRARSARETRA